MSFLDGDKFKNITDYVLNAGLRKAQEAEKKTTLLEETRQLYQGLEEDLSYLNR